MADFQFECSFCSPTCRAQAVAPSPCIQEISEQEIQRIQQAQQAQQASASVAALPNIQAAVNPVGSSAGSCPASGASASSATPSRSITFIKSWGAKSWLVNYQGPYSNNNRPPHVEVVGFTPVVGQVYHLTNLHVTGQSALVWDVVGATNSGNQAHFTVYYGHNPQAQLNNHK